MEVVYEKGILDLPMTSLVEDFKCAQEILEMRLSGSKEDLVFKATSVVVSTGVYCNPQGAVHLAQGACDWKSVNQIL